MIYIIFCFLLCTTQFVAADVVNIFEIIANNQSAQLLSEFGYLSSIDWRSANHTVQVVSTRRIDVLRVALYTALTKSGHFAVGMCCEELSGTAQTAFLSVKTTYYIEPGLERDRRDADPPFYLDDGGQIDGVGFETENPNNVTNGANITIGIGGVNHTLEGYTTINGTTYTLNQISCLSTDDISLNCFIWFRFVESRFESSGKRTDVSSDKAYTLEIVIPIISFFVILVIFVFWYLKCRHYKRFKLVDA